MAEGEQKVIDLPRNGGSAHAYFNYYFSYGQWRYYYASGLPMRGNRSPACRGGP